MNIQYQMKLAGWLSILSSVIAIPMLLLAIIDGIYHDQYPFLGYVDAFITLSYSIIFVFIFFSFRKLLNVKANIKAADQVINLIIVATYISIGLSIASIIFPEMTGTLAILEILLMVGYGLFYLYLGRTILRCDNELYGYRKYVAWLGIIEGACYLTIVLFPIAVLVSVVSGIITAKMFFASTCETGN
ncbi:MAG: hypothetical protein WAO71_12945 [Gallionella sp.]